MRLLAALLVTCGLRDYGLPPIIWGGDPLCEHDWQDASWRNPNASGGWQGGATGGIPNPGQKVADYKERKIPGSFCLRCGAWRGCLGLEPLHDCLGWATGNRCGACYVCHMVEIFAEVRRVLRDDGTLWIVIGDSYAANRGSGAKGIGAKQATNTGANLGRLKVPTGLKAKDLCGIPARVALALQADGWWWRRDIIWAKGLSFCPSYSGTSMPESVRDRPSTSHEYVFLFSKSRKYFYDNEAVKERAVYPADDRKARAKPDHKRMPTEKMAGIRPGSATYPKRNLRSVWAINPKGYKEAHFATYPEALIRPMILAGTSAGGACPECSAPWERVVERVDTGKKQKTGSNWDTGLGAHGSFHRDGRETQPANQPVMASITTGWRPTCTCNADYLFGPETDGERQGREWFADADFSALRKVEALVGIQLAPIPCVVLDPFMGSGTTAVVAKTLGRSYIGIELNPSYIVMAEKRLAKITGVQLELL